MITLGASSGAIAQQLATIGGSPGKTVDPGEVDAFFAVHQDGTVTLYSGKVDLGQGLRIAIPQMAAEELGIDVERDHARRGRHGLDARSGSDRGQ